jgi:hypothetical protein
MRARAFQRHTHQVKLNAHSGTKKHKHHCVLYQSLEPCMRAVAVFILIEPIFGYCYFFREQTNGKSHIAHKLCAIVPLRRQRRAFNRNHRKKAAADCFLRFNKGAREIISSAAAIPAGGAEELIFIFFGERRIRVQMTRPCLLTRQLLLLLKKASHRARVLY